jgi:hypothetical protein
VYSESLEVLCNSNVMSLPVMKIILQTLLSIYVRQQ